MLWTYKTRLTRIAASRALLCGLVGLLTNVWTGSLSFQFGQPPVVRSQPQQYFADGLFDGDLAGFP